MYIIKEYYIKGIRVISEADIGISGFSGLLSISYFLKERKKNEVECN